MRNLAGVDGPLELVHGFATVKQRAQFPPELGIAEEVAQEQRAQHLAQVIGCPVDGVALRGTAEPL